MLYWHRTSDKFEKKEEVREATQGGPSSYARLIAHESRMHEQFTRRRMCEVTSLASALFLA